MFNLRRHVQATVIPSEVEGPRDDPHRLSRGVLPLRCTAVGMALRAGRVFACVALVLSASLSTSPAADQPEVTAVLDNAETVIGQPVQLQIKVTGSRSATMPNDIAVEGLDIRYSGQSQLVEGRNFQFSYSVVYAYTIMPEKAGTFKIPAQSIRVGGTTLKTPELTLNVTDNSSRSAKPGRAPEPGGDPGKNGFVELVLTKSNAYVGEMIPAEVRLGFSTRTPVESLGNGIDLTGQGFTTQKMRDPRQAIETIHGKSYQTFTFKTAIAPARSGKIVIGPVQVNPVVRIPQMTNRSRALPRDPFSLNDPFFNNFFNDPSFAPSTPRQIKMESEPATLDVKALPSKAPPGFSGAVGIFTMTADAKPRTAQVGDPITITAKITGRGNFDRVTAPEFDDEKGWHKYPPSAEFKQDDDVGISGTKTFETVLSPNENKDAIPASVFTYFDPVKEQYVTLRSDRVPVQIKGGNAPVATPAPAAPAATPTNAPASASSASATTPNSADILYQLTDLPAARRTFTPVFARLPFWLAQLLPLIALLGFIGWKIRAARRDDREALRIAALQQESMRVERSLRRDDTPPHDYVAAAARAVQLRTALAKKLEPNAVDPEIAANAFRLDDATRERLRQLFAQRDEMRYSGSANGARQLSAADRRDFLSLIESLRR